jgi:hypothetical protein
VLRQAAKEHDMSDPKNGKGGFNEFARHEQDKKTTSPGTTGDVLAAPIPAAAMAKPDISPAAREETKLATPVDGPKLAR